MVLAQPTPSGDPLRLSSASWRGATVVLTAVATLAASLLAATPAEAVRVTPGSFTGYGFDQCETQTQEAMDTWLTTSPYWAVGIYIAGDNRYCGDDRQFNLTPTWVQTQLRKGWRLLPLTVGLQASCSSVDRYARRERISPDPTDDYATAREQGRTEATTTVQAARALGIAARSTLWFDLENFDEEKTRCRESALGFLSAWTHKLHALGYVSGVYSSAGSGIRALDDARFLEPGRYTMPDQVWIAEWVKPADYQEPPTATPPTLLSSYVRDDGWMPNNRMRQYRGGHHETYGGVTINIDSNYLDLGRGSVAPRAPGHCGVQVDFPRYRRLSRGDDGDQVKAAQCLLRQKHFYKGELRFRYTWVTQRAVRAFQRAHDLPATGNLTRQTWTALLSEGRSPLVKVGSANHAVRRMQRALNAAIAAQLPVTGVFDAATTSAVRDYQRERGMYRTGVVAEDTWAELQRGRR